MDTRYADAVVKLEEEVDRACHEAHADGVLSHEDIAKELRRIAQGWLDAR